MNFRTKLLLDKAAKAYPGVKHLSGAPDHGKLHALLTDIRPGWKGPTRTNTLAYYEY